MDDLRLQPDKQAYEDAMKEFYKTLFVEQPRSLATTKVALTTSASRTFTREYGVEFNILMTKLEGEERTVFGFDKTPERRHFAVKIYGKVYEFGPWPQHVRKTLFLDWCANHLDFEFASVVDKMNANGFISELRRPVAAFTMQSEEEFDVRIQLFCNHFISTNRRYHPEELNCFIFIKLTQMILDPELSPDSEICRWISKYTETLNPIMRRNIQRTHQRLNPFVGDLGMRNRTAEIVSLDSDGEMDDEDDCSSDTRSPSSSRASSTVSSEEIEVIELD